MPKQLKQRRDVTRAITLAKSIRMELAQIYSEDNSTSLRECDDLIKILTDMCRDPSKRRRVRP